MKKNGVALLILVLLIVGILAVAGGIYYYQKQKEKVIPITVSTSTPTITPTSTPTASIKTERFIYPVGGENLPIGSRQTIKWEIPKRWEDERYTVFIYLDGEDDEMDAKFKDMSIIGWNYAKNGETYGIWEVGIFYDDLYHRKLIGIKPGKYKLRLYYAWDSRPDDQNYYLLESNFFNIVK